MAEKQSAMAPLAPTDTELPSVEEALAYASGFVAGLDAAKDQDAAALIKERDIARVELAFERALRMALERDKHGLQGKVAAPLPEER